MRTGGSRRLIQNGIEDNRGCIACERLPPGRHLVENRPKRKRVVISVQLFAPGLFRRHVSDRPQNVLPGLVR